MPSLVDLLGTSVINYKKEPISTLFLSEHVKVIGLYFSGLFPTGQAFTSLLKKFYESFQSSSGDGEKRLEIVYVGTDEDDESFDYCVAEMPWLALPFDAKSRMRRLLIRYSITSLPALVLIEGATGKLITTEGRDCLSDDLDGTDFPWARKTVDEILDGELLSDGERVDSLTSVKDMIKGFYFSAHWCPPCRSFTPMVKHVYEKVKAAGHKFEIVFVTSDRSESSFKEYYKTMPWLALPYQDPRIKALTRHFSVGGIPCLVLVDEHNELISFNCRTDIMDDPDGMKFPWRPQIVEVLTDANSTSLGETACLILFTDGDRELIFNAPELMTEAAEQYVSEQKVSVDADYQLPPLRFFYEAEESEEIADSIRTLVQLDGRKPILAIIDSSSGKTFSAPEGEISKGTLDKLIADFRDCAIAADNSETIATADPAADSS